MDYADDVGVANNSYSALPNVLQRPQPEAIGSGMQTTAYNTKVNSVSFVLTKKLLLTPLCAELVDVEYRYYLGSTILCNRQGAREIGTAYTSRRPWHCLWSRQEIKLLHGCGGAF